MNWIKATESLPLAGKELPKTKDGLSAERLERIYQEAMGGNRNANMTSVFRDDLPEY